MTSLRHLRQSLLIALVIAPLGIANAGVHEVGLKHEAKIFIQAKIANDTTEAIDALGEANANTATEVFLIEATYSAEPALFTLQVDNALTFTENRRHQVNEFDNVNTAASTETFLTENANLANFRASLGNAMRLSTFEGLPGNAIVRAEVLNMKTVELGERFIS